MRIKKLFMNTKPLERTGKLFGDHSSPSQPSLISCQTFQRHNPSPTHHFQILSQLQGVVLPMAPKSRLSIVWDTLARCDWAGNRCLHIPVKNSETRRVFYSPSIRGMIKQLLSRCGPRTSSIRITWELVRNANYPAPPQTCWSGSSEGGAQPLVFS